MEYETKKWVVRWIGHFDFTRNCKPSYLARKYDRQFTNQFQALKYYRKMMEKEVLSVYLVRIDVKNKEYIIDSMDKALPVTYSEV